MIQPGGRYSREDLCSPSGWGYGEKVIVPLHPCVGYQEVSLALGGVCTEAVPAAASLSPTLSVSATHTLTWSPQTRP